MRRILIIDDALDVARLLRSALLSLDPKLQVSVVPSGEEALLEVTRGKPDLIIADVRLPGISGFDLIRKLNKKFDDLRVIVITGLSDPEVERQAVELNCRALLHKPMDMSVYLETVKKALGDLPPASTKSSSAGQPAPAPEISPPVRLTDILIRLHQQIEAGAVALLDDRARLVALAGSLPVPDFETVWAPEFMGAVSASYRVNRLAGGSKPRYFSAWNGEDWNITLVAIGTFVLAVTYPSGKESRPLVKILDKLITAQRELETALEGMGISTWSPGTGPLPKETQRAETQTEAEMLEGVSFEEDPGTLKNFAALFEQKTDDLARHEVDAFWEQSVQDKIVNGVASSDDLTYDQARKLGLVPGESTE